MPGTTRRLRNGDIVVDSETATDDRDEAIIVNTPGKQANEWDVGNDTVADHNPDYPADDPVSVVVYRDTLEANRPYYTGGPPLRLSRLAADRISYYAFPESRLEKRGRLSIKRLPLAELQPAPWHSRTFTAADNADFIDWIASEGGPGRSIEVRIDPDAPPHAPTFELINGHKRVWACTAAGLETVPCRCLYLSDEEYARSWANSHLSDYDPADRAEALSRLRTDFESVAADHDRATDAQNRTASSNV